MKTNLFGFKSMTIGVVSVFMLLLFGFYSLDFNGVGPKFKYDGTYSLYIESIDGLNINWITTTSDSGYYELLTKDNELIVKGKTAAGKVHNFRSTTDITDITTLRFGGQSDSIYQVKLKPFSNDLKSIYSNVDSLFIIGDVHGRYNELINLLQRSNVIDGNLNWLGGTSHLVFLGDLFDRGNDVTKVLWFIYELEDKAVLAGGKVHLVLGNHEIMTMSNDLRYVGPKENAIASTYGIKYNEMYHPTNSFLGKWLTSKPSVLKIGNAIFAHGGIVDLGTESIQAFNEMVNGYIQEPVFLDIMAEQPDTTAYSRALWNQRYAFFYSPLSPFWYRGYVKSDTLQVQLNAMLRKHNSKVHIVAHTPLENISSRYNGKLLTTDLNEAATQLLLLVKKGRKYKPFKIDSKGLMSKLN